jgi:hypothetical protein
MYYRTNLRGTGWAERLILVVCNCEVQQT